MIRRKAVLAFLDPELPNDFREIEAMGKIRKPAGESVKLGNIRFSETAEIGKFQAYRTGIPEFFCFTASFPALENSFSRGTFSRKNVLRVQTPPLLSEGSVRSPHGGSAVCYFLVLKVWKEKRPIVNKSPRRKILNFRCRVGQFSFWKLSHRGGCVSSYFPRFETFNWEWANSKCPRRQILNFRSDQCSIRQRSTRGGFASSYFLVFKVWNEQRPMLNFRNDQFQIWKRWRLRIALFDLVSKVRNGDIQILNKFARL